MKKVISRIHERRYEMRPGDLKPYALGHALGMMSMLVLVFYGLFVWFSSYDSTFIVAKYPISFSFLDWTFLFGLVQSYVMFYVLGWVFAKFYNSV
mgnify:CR=1 FL=1